jgi:hypothetical protein
MGLMIESFNFCVGSLGCHRISDLIYWGPFASKTVAEATSESYIGSSREANSLVSIKPGESKRSIVNTLDEIMDNFDFSRNYQTHRVKTTDRRESLTTSATTIKRTSPIYTIVSPIALKMSGCQA